MNTRTSTIVASFATMVALPALANEKSFFHVPGVDDFRYQEIARDGREDAWPFTVDEGYLACAYVTGQPTVYFVEIAEEGEEPRATVVSTEPFMMLTGAAMGHGLLAQTSSVEGMGEMIRLLGPFEALGKRLCEQPAGTHLGGGEL